MRDDRVCVILVSARNPLNIGAVARAMCNFGFHRLRVVNPYDAAFREARSAVGALSVLVRAEEFNHVSEAVADCSLVVGTTAVGHRQLQHPLKTLAEGAPLILAASRNTEQPGGVAILFGSEKFGLSNEDLSYCNWLLHIPTAEEQPSMNLAQAVAVCLYELVRRQPEGSAAQTFTSASAAELERITTTLLSALDQSGYMAAGAAADKEEIIRRLIRRLNLSAADCPVWLGILRQIQWKLNRDN